MGTFAASLRALGDVQGLPATVELQDGRLSIAAGDTAIGEWDIKDLRMEPIPTGYRIAAEGDQILLELKDIDAFNEELSAKRSRFRRKKKGVQQARPTEKTDEPRAPEPTPPPPSPLRLEPRQDTATTKPAKPKRSRPEPRPAKTSVEVGIGTKLINWVDATLDKASDRLGPYLPEWMFTRLMFAVAFVAVILALILPGLVSVFMLISGALIIVFGAVVYSDPMLASRWLPGRTTPTHVLLFGVTILMLGVLLGVIAN